jgi:hypothetical protein
MEMPMKEKKHAYHYMLTLMYGAETWAWTKVHISRLMATEMRSIRNTQRPKEIKNKRRKN